MRHDGNQAVEASRDSRKLSEPAVTDDHCRLQVLIGGTEEVPPSTSIDLALSALPSP